MNKEIEYEIGKRIRIIRKARGLSQTQVVDQLAKEGVYMSRETLSKIENNSRSISAVELNALCKVFNVDMSVFFHEEEPEDLVTFFRKRNFSQNALEEISQLQEMVKLFINQEKIYREGKKL